MGSTLKSLSIRHTIVGNEIVDDTDVFGASPVGSAPTTSSFLSNRMRKHNSKTGQETFKFGDLVQLILEVWPFWWSVWFIYKVFFPDDSSLSKLAQFVSVINANIKPFHLEIKKAISEENGSHWYGLVSNAGLGVNTLRTRQNGRHFADNIFRCIFFNENVWILLKISLKFVPKVQINSIPALVQIMAWRRPGHYLKQWWLHYDVSALSHN